MLDTSDKIYLDTYQTTRLVEFANKHNVIITHSQNEIKLLSNYEIDDDVILKELPYTIKEIIKRKNVDCRDGSVIYEVLIKTMNIDSDLCNYSKNISNISINTDKIR